MPGCCSTFEDAAGRQFDGKKVAAELRRYRERGPGDTARLLIEGIERSGNAAGTVLDVGAGLGAIAFSLLERGASSAVAVDASSAYIAAAREEAARRGTGDAVRFVHADFVEAADTLPSADIVALDRVVCCYPAVERLLEAALGHTRRCLALSYPRDRWHVRAALGLENLQRRATRNSFRTFVHSVPAMERTIRAAGFELTSRRETWVWAADVYVRH